MVVLGVLAAAGDADGRLRVPQRQAVLRDLPGQVLARPPGIDLCYNSGWDARGTDRRREGPQVLAGWWLRVGSCTSFFRILPNILAFWTMPFSKNRGDIFDTST